MSKPKANFSQIFLALMLSATVAWMPVAGHAQVDGSRPAAQSQDATDGIPVLVHDFDINGEAGLVMVAPVPVEAEPATVKTLVKNHPDTTVLAVSGVNDPALQAFAEAGGDTDRTKTVVISDVDQAPILNTDKLPVGLRQKVKAKLHELSAFVKEKKWGIALAVTSAAIIGGGTTLYTSAGIQGGLSIFTHILLLNAFIVTQADKWQGLLDKGGNAVRDFVHSIARLMGRDLSESGKETAERSGQFIITGLVNSAVALNVLYHSGNLLGAYQVFFYGFILLNYGNVWDPTVFRKLTQGKISKAFVGWYFAFQVVLGAALEALSYLRITSYADFVLGAITIAGLIYLFKGDTIEKKSKPVARIAQVKMKRGVATAGKVATERTNAVVSGVQRFKSSCESALAGAVERYRNRYKVVDFGPAYEDTQ